MVLHKMPPPPVTTATWPFKSTLNGTFILFFLCAWFVFVG
jgi:hypothetical protein